MQAAEARMRRALGLAGGAPKPRVAERTEPAQRAAERFVQGHKRRFVQDGEVPVTVVSGRRDGPAESTPHRGPSVGPAPSRLEAAEAALAHETAARHQAERALTEAHATVHDLQTKLGHAELARTEAADGLSREREATATLRAALRECQERLRAAETARTAAERAAHGRGSMRVAAERAGQGDAAGAAFTPARRGPGRRGRPASKKPAPRSKLVRWWIKDDAQDE